MELPDNWESFKTIVKDNIKTYCKSDIWPFQYEQFTAWLNNFDDPIDEYLALQLIDSLIIRSSKMAKVGYARLLHGQLRQLLIDENIINSKVNIEKWKRQLKTKGLQEIIRFSPVYMKNEFGESGGVIYRTISSDVNTNKYSFSESLREPKVIVLVDDFVGSGNQFIENFSNEFNLQEKLDSKIVVYCPLIAFETGLENIQKAFPKLKLLPVETIYKKDSFFDEDKTALFKNDQINTVQDVENHFQKMHIKYGPGMPSWFGYESAALPLIFEWGCPNQSPSILWMDSSKHTNDWHQLFNRRS